MPIQILEPYRTIYNSFYRLCFIYEFLKGTFRILTMIIPYNFGTKLFPSWIFSSADPVAQSPDVISYYAPLIIPIIILKAIQNLVFCKYLLGLTALLLAEEEEREQWMAE